MQEKIIELETRYSFHEDMLRELNEVIIRQQRQLDTVSEELAQLKSQLAEVSMQQSEPGVSNPQDEKPPHY
jgi:SlyX protein